MRLGQKLSTNKTDYYSHGSTLLPQDIASGDIIELRNGKEFGIILGLVYNTQRLAITKIHVAKISRDMSISKSRPAFFLPSVATRNGDVSGIDLPAHIYTDLTNWYDLPDISRKSNRVERAGYVSPQYLSGILSALRENHIAPIPEFDNHHVYTTSLNHLMGEKDGQAAEGLVPYAQLDDYDRALLIRDLNDPVRHVGGDQVTNEYFEIQRQKHQQGFAGYLRGKERAKQELQLERVFYQASTSRPQTVALAKLATPFKAANTVAGEDTDIIQPYQRQTIKDNCSSGDAVSDSNGLKDQFEQRRPPKTITLPKHLWQGRYLMLNIGELDKGPSQSDGTVFHRPCAVWKAYADKVSGELVGLELHPVTRKQAKNFIFKMSVFPLKTESERESFLIADCLIRVPLTAEYFHENAVPNFYELPADKMKTFIAKKDAFSRRDGVPLVVGLENIPENWVEVELDARPSEQQLRKWAQNGHIKFDTFFGNKIPAYARGQQPT